MSRKTAILVVEDRPVFLKEVYKEALSSLDVDDEYATNKDEALEKVRCRTYDIAFIDIMLTDDTDDRGGVEVVKYIDKLNEGTSMIVVSGTDDVRVPIDTYNAGIVDFILKTKTFGEKDVLEKLEKVLKYKRHRNYFGKFGTLNAYLATPEMVYSWEMAIMTHLEASYDILNNALFEVLERMLPIMRKKGGWSFTMDTEPRGISGSFWSKGLGKPIWISIASKDNELTPPPQEAILEEIYKGRKGKLLVGVWTMAGIQRDDYYDSIWEEIKR